MRSRSEKKFSSPEFKCGASDTYVNYSVMAAAGAHKNPARPQHLDALFDQNALIGLSHAIGNHPRRSAARGRSGRTHFGAVEHHARVQTSRRINRFARHEVNKFSARLLQ